MTSEKELDPQKTEPSQTEPHKKTDLELVQESTAGNLASFEELYRRHMRRVYALCLRMTGDATEAEDLTQEVFTHLFRKLGSFRGESAFTTWLHRLAVNLVLAHFRKRQSRPQFTAQDDETPEEIVRGTENPSSMPVFDRLALEKAIAQLAPRYRQVFVLHDVEGFEQEEIAQMLGISVGTSKSQLHRARLNLRKLINQNADASARP
jgi:RNA polymerase sigma-70 factor, ECF subfamily